MISVLGEGFKQAQIKCFVGPMTLYLSVSKRSTTIGWHVACVENFG